MWGGGVRVDEQSCSNLWKNIKWSNIYVIRKGKGGAEKIWKNNGPKVSKVDEIYKWTDQRNSLNQSTINTKKKHIEAHCNYITENHRNHERKLQKHQRKKRHIIHRGTKIRNYQRLFIRNYLSQKTRDRHLKEQKLLT